MTFEEKLQHLDMSLTEILLEEIEPGERESLAELIGIASDTNSASIEVTYDAATGKKLRNILERYLNGIDFDEKPEQMLGNPAYDLVAKDRASGY